MTMRASSATAAAAKIGQQPVDFVPALVSGRNAVHNGRRRVLASPITTTAVANWQNAPGFDLGISSLRMPQPQR
jgi:hypothetical protein